ncbi:MAG: site-2 protease family protein [Candidatus Aminicenantes bacterium]|nr:site-2 protease family protein [Candidatus Aminicenantes bacterium]
MKHSWRIGRIAGIDIYIDSSWFLILILFTWSLASSYFPQEFPGWSALQHWIIGFITSLLIFGSVLIHELAHSLVAISQGEEVRNITLFILGGVAQINEEPKKPMQEFLMAFAGPLTSLAIGLVAFILSLVLKPVNEPLGAITSYLALINVILAVFNLLPGFPMDGGRVLRSIIWKITGDLRKATRIASRIGQGFAFFLVFIGILQILKGSLGGFWLIFIGWFLHSAAARSYQKVMVDEVLKGVRAKDLMTKDFASVPSTLRVQDLVDDYILRRRERVFLVKDGDELKGIVCLEDVKKISREERPASTVSDIMTPREKLEAVSSEDDGRMILSSLTSKNIHQVPVMESDRVVGLICRTDVLRFIQLRRDLGA